MLKLLGGSFFGGWVSGALGLGGGSIFNPLLLSLGYPPTVATTTGGYMIIFSTFAVTLSYSIAGIVPWDYALWVGFLSIVGTYVGMWSVKGIMKKLGRQSPLVILLATMLGLSGLAVIIFNIVPEAQADKDHWSFRPFCV